MSKELYASMVIINGNIWTMDKENPRAGAIAMLSNSIIKVANDKKELDYLIGSQTKVIDAHNNTVIPGFIDAHTHIAWVGLNKIYVDLGETKSIDEVKEILKKEIRKKKPGEWIIGRNWDQSNWKEQRYITAKDLDEISDNHPIFLRHVSGHMVSVNSEAFKRLKLTKEDKGVDLDSNGNIIGTLRDIDFSGYTEIQPSLDEYIRGIKLGMQECLANGITSIHDNITYELFPAYLKMLENNDFTVRVYGIIYEDILEQAIKLDLGKYVGTNWFRIGAVKLMTDGAISTRTAYLFEEYSDKKGEKGFALYDNNKLEKMVGMVHEAGLQIAAHAIGDKAIANLIDTITTIIPADECTESMHRIEHAELVRKADIEKAKGHGIVFSMQPNFVWRWGLIGVDGMYEQRLGKERTLVNNPFRWVLDNDLLLAFGSDSMPLGPLYGIKGALFHPNKELQLTLEEAIKSFTLIPAQVEKQDKIKGSIKEGKLADIVILNQNLDELQKEEFDKVKVAYTIVDGKVAFFDGNTNVK